mgnify:CR=1 FL=1
MKLPSARVISSTPLNFWLSMTFLVIPATFVTCCLSSSLRELNSCLKIKPCTRASHFGILDMRRRNRSDTPSFSASPLNARSILSSSVFGRSERSI